METQTPGPPKQVWEKRENPQTNGEAKLRTAAVQTDIPVLKEMDLLAEDALGTLISTDVPEPERYAWQGELLDDGRNADTFKSVKPGNVNTTKDKPRYICDKRVIVQHKGRKGLFHFLCCGERKLVVDDDLLAHLLLEAAFLPRTVGLARSLINSAKRFFNYYDTTRISRVFATNVILSTVTVAMTIGRHEAECVRFMGEKVEIKKRQEMQEIMGKLS